MVQSYSYVEIICISSMCSHTCRDPLIHILDSLNIWNPNPHAAYSLRFPLTRTSIANTICWVVKLSQSITWLFKQNFLFDFLIRKKYIWQHVTPFLYVIRCSSIFLKYILAIVRSNGDRKSTISLCYAFTYARPYLVTLLQNLSMCSRYAHLISPRKIFLFLVYCEICLFNLSQKFTLKFSVNWKCGA